MVTSYQVLNGLDPEYIERLCGRFWGKVDRTGDCWEWQAASSPASDQDRDVMKLADTPHRTGVREENHSSGGRGGDIAATRRNRRGGSMTPETFYAISISGIILTATGLVWLTWDTLREERRP